MDRKKQRTKRIIRIGLLVGTVGSLFWVPWVLVWAWIIPLPNTVQEQVDQAIGYGFDGMIVYVDQKGQSPQFYTGGWKDRQNKIPADPRSLFKIASISKLYVAVAITKLIKEERLSLNGTLAEYFPSFADRIEYAQRITVKSMLQHRSGIPNFTNHPDYWMNPPTSAREKLELVLDLPASFEPEKGYEYSNTNYLLLAKLIELAVGYDHHQYIKETILTPLALQNTFGTIHEVDMNDVMSGYYVGIEADLKTDDSGSMLATAEDLGVFIRALNEGAVFKNGEQDLYSSVYVYDHTGLIPGYQSIAEYHKELDAVVIQFVNTTNFSGYTWNLSEIAYNRIVDILKKKQHD